MDKPHFIRHGDQFVNTRYITHITAEKTRDVEHLVIHLDTPTQAKIAVPLSHADEIQRVLGMSADAVLRPGADD